MKGYPKWFSPYGEPRCYEQEPKKELRVGKILKKENIGNYTSIEVSSIPEGTESIYIEANTDGYDDMSVEVQYIRYEMQENKNYNADLKRYQKKLQEHEIRHKEWKDIKDEYDKDMKSKEQENERKLYKKLKKKFEG